VGLLCATFIGRFSDMSSNFNSRFPQPPFGGGHSVGHASPYGSSHSLPQHPPSHAAPARQVPAALQALQPRSARTRQTGQPQHGFGYYASCGPCRPSPSPPPGGGIALQPMGPHNGPYISQQPSAQPPMANPGQLAMHLHHPVLSSQMCWDAVSSFGHLTGLLTRPINPQHDLVSLHDSRISSAHEMASIPPGHSIGFYDGDRLAHVMVSTGAGRASGNKNDCVGVGNPIGWENLDLANDLNWHQGGVQAPPNGRLLTVVHRPLSEAGMPPQPPQVMQPKGQAYPGPSHPGRPYPGQPDPGQFGGYRSGH